MKCIHHPDDMLQWSQSPAFSQLSSFIQRIGSSIIEKPWTCEEVLVEMNTALPVNELTVITGLKDLLQNISRLVDSVKLEQQASSRYGNKSFRAFHAQLQAMNLDTLPEYAQQLLLASFGNPIRLDYGSGHELFFLIFCMVITGTNQLSSQTTFSNAYYRILGISVFSVDYLHLIRRIVTKFMLEPAGSHGVWGLDDHQFLPFIFGAAQLTAVDNNNDSIIHPQEAVTERILNNGVIRRSYIYIDCLAYAHEVKTRINPTVPFAQHSPLLHDISLLPKWRRIYDGLGRMYMKEVLDKFPIMQHLLFHAKLFPFREDSH